MRARVRASSAVALAVVLGLVMPSTATAAMRAVDVARAAHMIIGGTDRIATAGDVNGDDAPDAMITTYATETESARVRVLFGPLSAGRTSFEDYTGSGFEIIGTDPQDGCCRVSPAGDVNGDGLDDILVAASLSDNNARGASGTVYVVFGKDDSKPLHLGEFDDNTQIGDGFRIDGASEFDIAGRDVAPLADVNGDGLDDLVVGAPFAGASYVVYGKEDSLPVDLLTFNLLLQGNRGFRIDTPVPSADNQYSVGGAGDVNGDGVPDVIVGVITNTFGHGSAYVVFGKSDPFPVDVHELDGLGFRVKGPRRRLRVGSAVAGLGDVNGDGLSDVAVGTSRASAGPGKAYVVWGKEDSSTVRLAALGGKGFLIRGVGGSREFKGYGEGRVVARGGDLNGDNIPDVLVAAPSASYGAFGGGAAYVVLGKPDAATVRLADLGSGGYRIDGTERDGHVGTSLSASADLTGDGRRDVLIGGWGSSYVLSLGGLRF